MPSVLFSLTISFFLQMLDCVASVEAWEHLANIVPHCAGPSYDDRLLILNVLAKSSTHDINMHSFFNGILVNMLLRMKHADGKAFQLGTLGRKMRTFFAVLAKEGIPWKYKDFKGFNGCVVAIIRSYWQENADTNKEFGTKANCKVFEDGNAQKI